MNLLQRVWQSSLGKKYLMALTGAALFLFVVGHMMGNLQVFLGPQAINRYGHFLKTTPEILWPARIGLLACVGLHMIVAVALVAQNRAARPVAYAKVRAHGATAASRTMIWSGLIILTFVIYHLLHYTLTLPSVNGYGLDFSTLRDEEGRHDIFAMIVMGFQKWPVSLFYFVAVGLLCTHLGHGIGSMFQSLGLKNNVWGPRIAGFARAASVLLFLGYASIPAAVLGGFGGGHLEEMRRVAQQRDSAAPPDQNRMVPIGVTNAAGKEK
ncbi:MAG: succinate dehydrogenase cytochrome b subunit [Pedosphaera sp.]|nr:succinate dehydrogenase cytochrome b subunit [Pedosphaera sp.]